MHAHARRSLRSRVNHFSLLKASTSIKSDIYQRCSIRKDLDLIGRCALTIACGEDTKDFIHHVLLDAISLDDITENEFT